MIDLFEGEFSGLVRLVLGPDHRDGHTESADEPNVVLPSSVRYSLRYGGAVLNGQQIVALSNPKYKGLGIYLAMKALGGAETRQLSLLQTLADHFNRGNSYEGIGDIIESHLQGIFQISVVGQKAAQISRMGFEFVDQKFGKMADDVYSNSQLPLLLLYSTMIGFKPFIERLQEGSDLVMINPKQAGKDPKSNFGYKITNCGTYVDVSLVNDQTDMGTFPRVLVDDTKKTGSTLTFSREFLRNTYPSLEIAGQLFMSTAYQSNIKAPK